MIKSSKDQFIKALDKLDELSAIADDINVDQWFTVSPVDRMAELSYIAISHGLTLKDVNRLDQLINIKGGK